MDIKWNKGWKDDLHRQALKVMQEAYDAVHRSYAGHPVDRVKDALRREFKRRGIAITDPELTQFAEVISEGKRLSFKKGRAA